MPALPPVVDFAETKASTLKQASFKSDDFVASAVSMLLGRAHLRTLRRTSTPRRILLLVLLTLVLDALVLIANRPRTLHAPPSPRSLNSIDEVTAANRTVFIASVHRDTAPLLHAAWSGALVDLLAALGSNNVYVSIVESGSQDGTRSELAQLKRQLDERGVSNAVTFGPTGWDLLKDLGEPPAPEEMRPGWVSYQAPDRSDGTTAEKRVVPYLAEMRNLAMAPLTTLAAEGRTFDTVLWIDDVVFSAQDAITLLDTRGGDYAAACSTTIGSFARLHDTMALRDIHGRPPASSLWPWFASHSSRAAALAGEPVPVYSCWDGLVALTAGSFYHEAQPLRFRAVDDRLAERHVEASERCLLHADNPLSSSAGIWLNPSVRVSRNLVSYEGMRQSGQYPGWTVTVAGTWVNRVRRWRWNRARDTERDAVISRVNKWAESGTFEDGSPTTESGLSCLMDDMLVMRSRGWSHL